MNRRTLLKALGLSAGSLYLPSLSRAATAAPARRILFFVSSHGTVYDNWRMRTGGQPDDQDFEFDLPGLATSDFSPILQPLQPWADRLLVLDGLGNGCGHTAAFNEHEEGMASCLTGRIPVPVIGSLGVPDGPSLDQVIAANQSTPFRSLEWAVGGWPINFDVNGQALPLESDAVAVFNRLFPTGPVSAEPTEADRIQALRGSVLSRLGDRYDALSQRLSGEDRLKLEQHRDLVRDLESRIEILATLQCEAGDAPDYPYPNYLWGDADYPTFLMDTFRDLSVAAFSCGLTNVLTIRLDHINNSTIGAPAGDLHNDFAHQGSTDPTAIGVMTDYHTYVAERFASLLAALDAVPEGAGTMLDNTLVVWTNELATGEHDFTDLPMVVAGGTDAFRSGRYVRWAPRHQLVGPWSQPWIGQPHNKLLTSLGNAMGLSLDHFGVTELTGVSGPVDCTGELDRLT